MSSNMLRIQSLASGSSGNAFLLESGDDLLLFDCGIGVREIQRALRAWGKTVLDLTGLVITHEHSDHVRALASFIRVGTPIYATAGTARALGLTLTQVSALRYGEQTAFVSLAITPVRTSHDAAEPCGLVIETARRTIGLVTDLGAPSEEIGTYASRCDLLILESNHDREMLRSGPYPAHLKRRVSGDFGHLSNEQASEFLVTIVSSSSGPSDIWLAHLSGTNNTPAVAKATITARIQRGGKGPSVTVLPRGKPGPTWTGDSVRPRQLQLLTDALLAP